MRSRDRASTASVLVTGGAGYIGSHTVKALLDAGYDVVVFDDLSRGHPEFIPGVRLVIGELSDERALADLFSENDFDAVLHFASESLVGESVRNPDKYFRRNVTGGISLLSAMVKAGVKKMVFSSSAAVYGDPESVPIPETAALRPVSPYGESKAFFEKALGWYDKAYGLKSVSLRYFNAAGADPSGRLGEEHDPETHLIPLVIHAVLTGEPITVFGNDYPTPDGTCIRDYIHVTDLAEAHVLALKALSEGLETTAMNIGTGTGFSVMEIIKAVEDVSGRKVPYTVGERRQGDPAVLIAECARARDTLGWVPTHSSLREIVQTAWRWHSRET
ncbi:MAG TPA: UDP-glucose 4-epimerase GalE [Firmicutes bacterium]|nr:UDP-glucose 4-epimerase GalE [Candidatus Fermentithermobacillaceae bacterium]